MKVMRLLTISLALIVLATSCQQATSTAKAPGNTTDKTYAIYTFSDAVTGAKIDLATGDTATIQYKASGAKPVTLTGTESDYGVIDFANDQVVVYNFEKADKFILTLTKANYKVFEGRANFPGGKAISGGVVNKDGSSDIVFFSSVLYPATIPFSTQAITFNVRNANTKAAVTTGSYIAFLSNAVTANTIDTSAGTTNLTQYIPTESSLGAGLTPGQYQGYTVSGAISATGTIAIPAGALFSGQQYVLMVRGVAGYENSYYDTTPPGSYKNSKIFTDGDTGTNLYFDLTPVNGTPAESTNTLNMISASNINNVGQVIKNTRSIILTFDKPIDVNYTALYASSLTANLSLTTANTDNDANGTVKGNTAVSAAGTLPTGLTISASGATLTITLAATDADLTAAPVGSLDTDDALTWDLSNIFNKIQVRPTDATNATTWSNLGGTPVGSKFKTVNGAVVNVSDVDTIVVR